MCTWKKGMQKSLCDKVNRQPALLSRKDLKRLGIHVSDPTLLRWQQNGRFPRRLKLAGCTCAWLATEVEAWLAECAAARANHVYADV